jgi:predicted transcriptional regulator
MPKIILESEKIDEVKNQLEMLIQTAQRIEVDNYQRHIRHKMEILDKKEEDIIEFVKNNPGTSKQGVVDSVDYARVTILKAIKNLVNYGIITQELDNRKHRLYVNDKSIFKSSMDDIKSFKKSYFSLVRMANKCYKKIEGRDDDEMYSWMISTNLIFILKHLITSYSLHAVFVWPKMIKDTEGLNRLYLTLFQSLNEIFSELGNYVPFHLKKRDEKTEFLKKDLMFLFQESKEYERLITEFHEYNLDREFDSAMSNLFKASKMSKEWKDYRAAIMEN